MSAAAGQDGQAESAASRAVLVCGWCPAFIPSQDEVQHHFFVAHGQAVDQSVRYFYPDDVDAPHERARLEANRV